MEFMIKTNKAQSKRKLHDLMEKQFLEISKDWEISSGTEAIMYQHPDDYSYSVTYGKNLSILYCYNLCYVFNKIFDRGNSKNFIKKMMIKYYGLNNITHVV